MYKKICFVQSFKWCKKIVHFFVCVPYIGVGCRLLDFASKTDQVDFTDWLSFLPFKIMEEISTNTEALSANT